MNTTAGQVHVTDSEGRLMLPKEFANTPVFVEWVSDSELVIRLAKAAPAKAGEEHWPEFQPMVLTGADRDLVLSLLDNPPPPNEALKRLMAGPGLPSPE